MSIKFIDFDRTHCLTGIGECPGEKHNMILVPVSDADMETARDALISKVLPDWADRAGGNWAKRWNNTVGQVTGIQIPSN
jgi:hypothetical protein